MSELIKSREELIEWFGMRRICRKEKNKEAFVSTKIRKDCLVHETQGKFVLGGEVRRFKFESIGGGVYIATHEKLF